jgi:D-alanyl-D-alanine endopeptidase (penicillin-binding protein 7)
MQNRSFSFLIAIVILTGIGIIAGVNLIIQSETKPVPDLSTEKIPVIKQKSTEPEMVTQGTFISATSSGELTAQSKIVATSTAQNEITAYAYLVGDVSTGKVYINSNSVNAFPVASMSKLVTAIVATNRFTPTTTIAIPELSTDIATDTSNLQVGEKFTLEEILQPLLLSSSNIAAEAIASTKMSSTTATSTAHLNFLELMSSTAWEIGMPKAYFADPSGLDPHNQASARDIFVLAQYLYTSRPDILKITRTIHATIATTTTHNSHEIDSTHPFIIDPRFIGGKTGRTFEAGETMLTILNIGDKPIAFVVLHSRYGYRAFDTNVLIRKYVELTAGKPE